jgi:hypothetical protein
LSGIQDFKFPDVTRLSAGFNLDREGVGEVVMGEWYYRVDG